MNIRTLNQKNAHLIASQIPDNLWRNVFSYGFNYCPYVEEEILNIKPLDQITPEYYQGNILAAFILTLIHYPTITPRDLITHAKNRLDLQDRDIFGIAAIMGRTDILQSMKESEPSMLSALTADDYHEALTQAAENGHLNTLIWLREQEAYRTLIAEESYFIEDIFCAAAKMGHIPILEWLKHLVPDKLMELIQANDYQAFNDAASNGHNLVLDWLKQEAPDHLNRMIQQNDYSAFQEAAGNGHIGTLEWFKKEVPDQLKAMIHANKYAAFRSAAIHGKKGALDWLSGAFPNEFPKMMKATRTAVFVFAARNGHLDILKWIKRHAPYSFKHVVKWRGWEAFRQAYYREHLDICNWLLEYPSCFAYVEERDPAFGLVLHPFIEKKLNDLRQKAMTHTGNSPFDIHSRTQAKLYFYIASNLIRRNDRSLDDSLHFLLNIPHVKDLADQEVTPNESNELLRLALKVGNREAAAMLLNIENVRVLAADNNFYEEELLGSISLRQLVRDRESSMTALTSGEKKRLETAIAKYQPMLETTSVPLLMDALRQQLMERYEAHPACIIINEVATILPAQWNSFKDLNLQGDDYKKALIAYYQNKNHTAWRYLSKPNPWMHAEAEYVCVNEDKTKRWADFEEYQSLIAMHWLAVNDESTEPSHGHTMEGRLNHFVDELALLGRSHNWDKTRMGFSGKEEEFDDLEADRPSCYSGVKRRVFQSVIGHPLFQILTKEILNLEIKDFALTYFKSKITHRNKQRLLSAFKNYCNQLTEESAAPLECLNIPQEAQVGFEDYLKQRYADQYTDDADLMAHVRQSITLNLQSPNVSDHLHALKLDGITQISCYLQKLNHVRSSEVGLFSASTPERRVTPERAVKKRRVEHGI